MIALKYIEGTSYSVTLFYIGVTIVTHYSTGQGSSDLTLTGYRRCAWRQAATVAMVAASGGVLGLVLHCTVQYRGCTVLHCTGAVLVAALAPPLHPRPLQPPHRGHRPRHGD